MLSRLARPVTSLSRAVTSRAASTQAAAKANIGSKSQAVFDRESKYGAHNYHPLPVALNKAEGNLGIGSLYISMLSMNACKYELRVYKL